MTPQRTVNLFRILFVAFGFFMGMCVGEVVFGTQWIGGSMGLIFGLGIVLIDRLLMGFSLRLFSAATFGLLLGLFTSRILLASDILHYASDQTRWVTGICVYSSLGYLGTMLAIRSSRDEFSLIVPYVRFRRTATHDEPVVVDSNVLIDGRIVEVCQTGFLSSSLVVPRFVLDELQRLSDSAENLKRDKGRRALDLLNDIQRRQDMTITIHDSVAEDDDTPVDSRLVQVAQMLSARLLTSDSNLARIARLEGVSVLNLNDLSRALTPVVSTGEDIELTLVKPGRDTHQAVGYLQDGSMIVVNHARAHLGEIVVVTLSSMLQTVSGRMYFAELKNPVAIHPMAAKASGKSNVA